MANHRALWQRLLGAALGGLTLSGAHPPLGWWWLVLPGVALLFWSLRAVTVPRALLVGLVGGFAFWGTHIFWLTTYLGPVPWLALAGVQTLFHAIAAVLISLVWRWSAPLSQAPLWRLGVVPILLAGVWTLREAITSTWPYGGFSWGRLAFAQSQSPFGDLASWVGASGLTFLLALVAAMLVTAIAEASWERIDRMPARLLAAGRRLVPAAAALIALLIPGWNVTATGETRVAAVQGSVDAGLFTERQRGEVLEAHVQATLPILDEEFDVLLWPENGADVNPLRNPHAASIMDHIAERTDAPFLFGTITDGVEDETYNSVLEWRAGEGAVGQYDKLHPVPFAEYLPNREFWYPLAPDLFDLVPRDYSFGERPNVMPLDVPSGDTLLAGIAICFDIVDDALMRQMIDGGAEIILAPTNNADFGESSESVQQLAIARLRAIEYGRTVVNISTVGTSAIIAPDGSTIDQLPTFEPGTMIETVPLSTTRTLAADIGTGVEIVAASLGVLGLALLGALSWRTRPGENHHDTDATTVAAPQREALQDA